MVDDGGFSGSEQRKRRLLSRISAVELRRRIVSLRKANLNELSNDAVRHRVGRIVDGYPFQIRPLQLNALYRARLNQPGQVFSSASELWYPPAEKVKRQSRLNDRGQVVFYASNMPNTAVIELRPKPNDVFTILLAVTHTRRVETIKVAFIGLERALAPEVQHLGDLDMFRHASHFRAALGEANYKKWLVIDDYLSEIFGMQVIENEEYKYKSTIALANLLFRAPGLDAVNYPSVAADDHGINICMLPERADQLFAPGEAWMVRIGESAVHPDTGEPLRRITFLRRSNEISADGTITWRTPGEGIDPEEIDRFARRRVLPLPQWPTGADNMGRA